MAQSHQVDKVSLEGLMLQECGVAEIDDYVDSCFSDKPATEQATEWALVFKLSSEPSEKWTAAFQRTLLNHNFLSSSYVEGDRLIIFTPLELGVAYFKTLLPAVNAVVTKTNHHLSDLSKYEAEIRADISIDAKTLEFPIIDQTES